MYTKLLLKFKVAVQYLWLWIRHSPPLLVIISDCPHQQCDIKYYTLTELNSYHGAMHEAKLKQEAVLQRLSGN